MIISDTVSEYGDDQYDDVEIISEQDISCDPDERSEYDMIVDEEQHYITEYDYDKLIIT